MNDRLDAYIVDEETDTRLRLRNTATETACFQQFYLHENFETAISELVGGKRCDVVFISGKLALDSCFKFIGKARTLISSQDAAFILVLGQGEDSPTVISRSLMGGISGFLVEPYSIDSLAQIVALAGQIKQQRGFERQEAAALLLAKEVVGHLDAVAALKAQGFEATIIKDRLHEACAVLQSFSPKILEQFHTMFVRVVEELPPLGPLPEELRYSGTSGRVKRQIERELLRRVKARISKEKEAEPITSEH